MPLKQTGRTGLRRAGIGIAAALLTGGCAAGRDSQTAYQRPSLDGTQATVGDIALRALTIQAPTTSGHYAKGSAAPMRLVLVNSGTTKDQLTSITSAEFSGWGAFASKAAAQAQSGGSASVDLPPGARVSWGTPESTGALLLTGFTKNAYPGTSVPITFTFARAGRITVRVPVGLSRTPNTSALPSATGGE